MAHVSTHPSPSPAAPRKEHGPPLRILVVAAEEGGGLVQSARQWAGDAGLELETAPDLPRAVRQLAAKRWRSEEHTSELQSPCNLVCRLLLEKKKKKIK